MVRRSRGKYTETQLQRCSKMGGAFGQEVDRLLLRGVGMDYCGQAAHGKTHQSQDVPLFVRDMQPEALFDYIPPRTVKGFDSIPSHSVLTNPHLLGQKLHALCREMDCWSFVAN